MTKQPSSRQLIALRKVQEFELGGIPILNPGDAEECYDKRWLKQLGKNYYLTPAGHAIVNNNNALL